MSHKTEDEIREALQNLDEPPRDYSAMSYEDGIREALEWVIGDIDDSDFEFAD